jgi:hypothetical protein
VATSKKTMRKADKAKTLVSSAVAAGVAEPAARKQGGEKACVDRRASSDRRGSERRKKDQPVAEERRVLQRRVKVSRRRQIDPTTCERDYTPDEVEFMNALNDYKRLSGRMFPTCSEVLEVVKKLGYQKQLTATLTEPAKTDFPCEEVGKNTAV